MAIKVKGPDGIVTEFPDGTDDATIDRVMAAAYRTPKKADTSAARGFALGATKPLDNLVRAASNIPGFDAVDRLGQRMGLPGAMAAADANDAARADNTRTGFQLAGNIAGTAPTMALPGGAAVQGAAGGALLTDARDGMGVARDAIVGGVGGKVADLGLQGLANTVAPTVNNYVSRLTGAGVPLTPGQVARAGKTKLGNAVAWAEDKATSLPFVGPMIVNSRIEGLDKFNRAFTERVLKPIGVSLPDTVQTGNEAVAFAQDAVRKAYQAVIPQTRGKVDNTFLTRTVATKARANLPQEQAAALDDVLKREVGQMFDAAGDFTGKRTGQVLDRLDKLGASFRKSQNTYERDLGEAIGSIRSHVIDLVRRNNPQAGKELQAANAAHANLVRLEKAVANTAEGIATPAQFRSAVVRSDRSARNRQAAGGRALGQDLAKAGEAVLPSKVPDSGTFTRAAAANPFALAMGAVAAPVYAAARAATPLVTRTAGPQSQYVAGLINKARAPISVAVPALLARPGNE